MDAALQAVRYYDALIGTGGIGSGLVVAFEGNHTLGREESRPVRILDRRDYAKLHIISHYVKKLLGDSFAVYPIGRVGADAVGESLTGEMREAGLDMRYVFATPDQPTLFAVAFHYPDGDGGNLTAATSASAAAVADDIDAALPTIECYGERAIALAVPETPLGCRKRLLEHASAYGLMRFASFLTAEVAEVLRTAMLEHVDVLSLNIDEGRAVAEAITNQVIADDLGDPDVINHIVQTVARRLRRAYPALSVVVTAGRRGSWAADIHGLHYAPAIRVTAESTAGAGDAHLAGLIVASVARATLADANKFGTLVAGMKVASPHTINPAIDAASVVGYASEHAVHIPAAILQLVTAASDRVPKRHAAVPGPAEQCQFPKAISTGSSHDAHQP